MKAQIVLLSLSTLAAFAQPQAQSEPPATIYKLDFVLTTRDGAQPATQRRYALST